MNNIENIEFFLRGYADFKAKQPTGDEDSYYVMLGAIEEQTELPLETIEEIFQTMQELETEDKTLQGVDLFIAALDKQTKRLMKKD
jgi:hypothetical protein